MTEKTYGSPTEEAQGRVQAALEIGDLSEVHPNAALMLRTRVLNLDIENSEYLTAIVERAKRIAVDRALGRAE
ncbi:hypothetical protein L7D48_26465 [Streptomyces sp. S1A]|uniref:hypothetical protein n=1 Tax=Streptomyces sp. ICN903 TaxID=2964654 RepID=UPI001ED9FCBE|nr:hypothetical protein [Streptomyces sp. ICN903]MCG3044079.1 hypothetical protein [Streptomyces sp. ICN903]